MKAIGLYKQICEFIMKNMDKILRLTMMVLLGYFLYTCSFYFIYDYETVPHTYKMEDFTTISGYKYTEDGAFISETDDPQLLFSAPYRHLRSVEICFGEPLQTDMEIQVFYRRKNKDFRENAAASLQGKQGDTKVVAEFNEVSCDVIRIDINGDFHLKDIGVKGDIGRYNKIKIALYGIVCVLFLICFWLFVSVFLVSLLKKVIEGIKNEYERLEETQSRNNTVIGRVLNFFERKKIGIEKVFFVLAIFSGILFSVMIPPDQVPDELTHYSQMMTDAGYPQLTKQIEQFYHNTGVGSLEGDINLHLDKELLQKHAGDKFDKSKVKFNGVSIGIVKHLPQFITFLIGYIFNFSIYHCMLIAEFGGTLLYAFLGYFTLKYLPFKKELMCAIMLFPMTIQQCSSVSYDAVMLPVCFFITAYLFYCIHEKEKVGWMDLGIYMASAVVMLLTKPTYLPIYLLVFLIPMEKWSLPLGKKLDLMVYIKRYKYLFILLCVLLFAGALYVIRSSSYVVLIGGCLKVLPHTVKIIIKTLLEFRVFFRRSMVACLGWMDTYLPYMFYHIVFIFLVLFSQENDKKIRKKDYRISISERLVSIVISVSSICLIIMVMFLWTFKLQNIDCGTTVSDMAEAIKQISISYGVQGRYLLPLTFFFFLPFDNVIKIKKKTLFVAQCIYYPLVIIWSLVAVALRYGY